MASLDFGTIHLPWRLLQALRRRAPWIAYLAELVSAPPSLDVDSHVRKLILATRLHAAWPLRLDRQYELMEFLELRWKDVRGIYSKVGYPGSEQFKSHIARVFESSKATDEQLRLAYKQTELLYTTQLMVEYDRFGMVAPYVDFLCSHFGGSLKGIHVVDYGCGVSDIGLLFATLGASVTIVDLEGMRGDFARWRYDRRGIAVGWCLLQSTEAFAKFDDASVDLFIATEVFEHIRDPLRLLQLAARSLKRGGILFDSMGGEFDREVEGDHLAESIAIGNSEEFRSFYKQHFDHLAATPSPGLNYLFQRKS